MCEYAWTSFDSNAKFYECLPEKGDRFHPAQKPVELYQWQLKLFAKEGYKILDTHLGSGSHRVASHKMNIDFYSTEIDEYYFNEQEKRFKEAIAQPLFDNVPLPEQQKLFT